MNWKEKTMDEKKKKVRRHDDDDGTQFLHPPISIVCFVSFFLEKIFLIPEMCITQKCAQLAAI